MECENCGEWIVRSGYGRTPRFCSGRCRAAAHRARRKNPFPAALTERVTWARADGKRPIQPSSKPASSTDRRTWSSFTDVQSGAGDGFGIMLGSGLGCYDLDHVTDAEARKFIASIPEPIIFIERSTSGDGVHVFIEAPMALDYRRTVNGISVERYTAARFIRVTGHVFPL